MKDPTTEFGELMERVRGGCAQATREVYERYSPSIRKIVRRRLDPRLRDQFDSMDFVHQVWASFFHEKPQQHDFPNPESLIAYLCKMAYHKVTDEYRHQHTQRMNLACQLGARARQEVPLEAIPNGCPTPSQTTIAKEQWDQFQAHLSGQERQILDLLRQGHSQRDVATLLSIDRKTIQRLILKLASTYCEREASW